MGDSRAGFVVSLQGFSQADPTSHDRSRILAEARLQTKEDGRQITIRRFGWSDDSQEAAEAMAQERAAEAMRRARAGEKLDRREFKTPYNGADGVPIREEILARHGDVVITRNSYGAPCLNTPDVLFLDVDFEEKAGCGLMVRIWQLLALIVVSYAIFERSWKYAAIGLAISAALAPMVASFLKKTWIRWSGGVEKVARKRINHFLKAHPDWNLRVYRTPAGFRLLALHRTFQSDDPEVESAFKSLDVDEMYAGCAGTSAVSGQGWDPSLGESALAITFVRAPGCGLCIRTGCPSARSGWNATMPKRRALPRVSSWKTLAAG
ncbi:hypothetical protein [Verrucomicrobium spinosum]|uniref:hypothetical protein n=1 Tax=Verrucomicrobium spinosum TaxID=2736 RepID=UPI000A64021A|nr:hypothetical protein [Verrucomicrobium spinosum]